MFRWRERIGDQRRLRDPAHDALPFGTMHIAKKGRRAYNVCWMTAAEGRF